MMGSALAPTTRPAIEAVTGRLHQGWGDYFRTLKS